jgi:hypothetical protein
MHFTETQAYHPLLISGAVCVLCYLNFILMRLLQNRGVNKVLVICALMLLSLPAIASIFQRIDTIIDDSGIHYRSFPFQPIFKDLPWQGIADAHFSRRIRYSRRTFIYDVYSVWSDEGLFLTRVDGKKIIIGTRKPAEMRVVLDTAVREHRLASYAAP